MKQHLAGPMLSIGLSGFLALGGPAPALASPEMLQATVTRVVDGDTVEVMEARGTTLRVHLVGIDAPEVAQPGPEGGTIPGQPFGTAARHALKRRVLRQPVQVVIVGQDAQGRSLGLLSQGGQNINLWLVREGWAWYDPEAFHATAVQREEMEGAEREARRAERGLWKDPHPEPPWDYRRRTGLSR